MLENLLRIAGIAQLCLVAGSFFIPKCLNWSDAMGTANKLTRQLFVTYACYTLGMHCFFGVICTFAPEALLRGDFLAIALCTLMAFWWGIRIILQFCCFDRSCIPQTKFNGIAETLLVIMFICLTAVYGMALWRNLI